MFGEPATLDGLDAQTSDMPPENGLEDSLEMEKGPGFPDISLRSPSTQT
jgi:hypothetical protein